MNNHIWKNRIGRCLAGLAAVIAASIACRAPDHTALLPLHTDGKVFRDSRGAIWTWRGVTAFSLLQQFVEGRNIGPYLDARRAAGANIVRVLLTMRNIAEFPPTAYSDVQLRAFLAAVHARGLRVELVALADAQDWPIEKQRAQLQRTIDAAVAGGGLDVVEIANEPFKNSAPPCDVLRGVGRRPGVLLASGDYEVQEGTLCVLDYVTTHNPRID